MRTAPAEEFLTPEVSAEVAAMSQCSGVDLPVSEAVASLTALSSGSGDAKVTSAALRGNDVSATLSCSGDFDFYILSPALAYTDRDGKPDRGRLSPVSIGYLAIDDEDLERIRTR